jgi:aryl-alcohol dehydrogenase-like predicted oxidoreductase
MRHRQLGKSELTVSEVGFGTWTLVTDWWGRTDDPHDMIKAALDAGINFFDTAPVYGADGAGETILREYLSERDDLVLTTKVGYDIQSQRRFPGQSERPHDWRPTSVVQQVDASLSRRGTDHIDLLQLHNPRIEPIVDDELWDTLVSLRTAGKVRELGVSLGPAIGWVDEGNIAIDDRPITTLQTVFNVLEQEPGLTFAARDRVRNGDVSLISRVPHASDALSGKLSIDTVLSPATIGRTATATTCSTTSRRPTSSRSCGGKPAVRSVKLLLPAFLRIPHSLPSCQRSCRSTRYASTHTPLSCRSPTTRLAPLTSSEYVTSTMSTVTSCR